MKAMAFTEHGSVFEWEHKKTEIEKVGMKYIHAIEAYITETLDEKIRDNYHCCLYARNYAGVREINKLISHSFNRKDNHFYYMPRIHIDDLMATSDNIIITTACLGGILSKGTDTIKDKFLNFLINNRHRCFLEVQHHYNTVEQGEYNKTLLFLSKKFDIPLIAGTDTHALNEIHLAGRKKLQEGKNVFFEGESEWDLTFKTYDELCKAYDKQGVLTKEIYLQAIENTNVLADMIEEFELDKHTKYPKLYDNPLQAYKDKINDSYKKHKYIKERYDMATIKNVLNSEVDTYEKTQSIDFMLLQKYQRDWEQDNDIWCGYGRGSVSGSEVAYVLGITEMDSMKFGLNFFR